MLASYLILFFSEESFQKRKHSFNGFFSSVLILFFHWVNFSVFSLTFPFSLSTHFLFANFFFCFLQEKLSS